MSISCDKIFLRYQDRCPCDLGHLWIGHYRGHLCFTNMSYSFTKPIYTAIFTNTFCCISNDVILSFFKVNTSLCIHVTCQFCFGLINFHSNRDLSNVHVVKIIRLIIVGVLIKVTDILYQHTSVNFLSLLQSHTWTWQLVSSFMMQTTVL